MSLNRKHFQEKNFYQKSLFIWIFLILTLWHTPNSNLGHLSYWVKVFKSDSRYKWNKKVSVVCVCVVQMNITMIFLWIHNSAVLFLMAKPSLSYLMNSSEHLPKHSCEIYHPILNSPLKSWGKIYILKNHSNCSLILYYKSSLIIMKSNKLC